MEFKDTSKNIKEKKRQNTNLITRRSLQIGRMKKKRMSSMAYIACSQPKSKLVIARLIFSHFSITEKKGNQSQKENKIKINKKNRGKNELIKKKKKWKKKPLNLKRIKKNEVFPVFPHDLKKNY